MSKAYTLRLKDDVTIHQGRQRARNFIYNVLKLPKVCELCGSTRFVDVHHRDQNPLNNVRENLLVCCRSCHEKEHRKKGVCILCGEPLRARGYCAKHLTRYLRHGDPLLAWGKIEEIEADDEEILEESTDTE